ncbi:MAG: hypothetical protein JXR83_04965 [Deltaproteobacteria bacterium]|nr:hypothetical protein [Deltaproteobacteria bacterium]
MTKLGRAPTVEAFSKAFRQGMEEALQQAAGRDGRLSKKEAERLAKSGNVFADNALNYLERTKQKSVSIDKLLDRSEAYAYAMAKKVAGPNRRLSLLEARALPRDLRKDFFVLRGKTYDEGSTRPAAELSSELKTKLDAVFADRWVSTYDLHEAIEPQLKTITDPAARAAFAQAVEQYIEAHPGTADEDKVLEMTRQVYGAATGHLYPPGQQDAFKTALMGLDMDGLQELFGDWSTQIAECAHEADARNSQLFAALREGCRMINQAAVDKSDGDMTMLGLAVDDASSMWGDESIMDGIARAALDQHAPGSDWGALTTAALERRLNQLGGLDHRPLAVGRAEPISDAGLHDLALTIGKKGMAYATTDDVPFRLMQIDDILRELGPRSDLKMIKAATETADDLNDPEETPREAFMFVVYNERSGQHVNFFIFENSLEPEL